MNVTDDIRYIGVDDKEIDLFEGQYIVPDGMMYNSYVILDEKIAVMDTVDARFGEEWLAKLDEALAGREPDYLIVQHMEPDHSANIKLFTDKFPKAVVVATAKAFPMMKNFYGLDFSGRQIVAGEGGRLPLGSRELTFITAPMVHWPEVMMTYDPKDKVLFSADGFGKFGASDAVDDEGWSCEARRYYFGIVGKYGMPVQTVLKKAAALDIQTICPLHGPVLSEDLGYYIGLYDTWSSYGVETDGVFIAYTSVYGNTRKAAKLLAEKLEAKGVTVAISDLAREDMAECVEDAFRHGKLVLATTTYNGEIFPFMKQFIDCLTERGYKNRTIGLIENGSWAPKAAKVMKGMLEGCKDITWCENGVRIMSGLSDENLAQIDALAEELAR
ncbi:MAG: FprA family A-type flavoprotein [Firmicutes bacterium]|nr:FprA family A-type flavoprotein [Bacillota bacterium]